MKSRLFALFLGLASLALAQPTIITAPTGSDYPYPATYTRSPLSVTAINAIDYQWFKDGVKIDGAVSSSYDLGTLDRFDAGSYTVKVSNSAGSVTSSPPAIVKINPPYEIFTDTRYISTSDADYLGFYYEGASGTLYYVAPGANTIRKRSNDYGYSTVAGGSQGYANGVGTAAKFNTPNDVILDTDAQVLYVADSGNNAIRKIALATNTVSLVAGRAGYYGTGNGVGDGAYFRYPTSIVLGKNGVLYVADTYNNQIRTINLATSTTSTPFGSTNGAAGYADGVGTAARFNLPYGLDLNDTKTVLYVADSGNNIIRKIDLVTNQVSTVVGMAGTAGYRHGPISTALLDHPRGVAFEASSGDLFIADTGNDYLLRVSSGIVTRLAGSYIDDYSITRDQYGIGSDAIFDRPTCVRSLAGFGTLLFSNLDNSSYNDAKISVATPADPVAVYIASAKSTYAQGETVTLSVKYLGSETMFFQWVHNGDNLTDGTRVSGSSQKTLTIANAQPGDAGDYTVKVANLYGFEQSDIVTITVPQTPKKPTITVPPFSTHVTLGQAVTLSVEGTGYPLPTYQWLKGGVAILGATSESYTIATTTAESAGDYSVALTNSQGTVTSVIATLAVDTAPAITTQPISGYVTQGNSFSLIAAASGSPAPSYQWFKDGASLSGATNATLVIPSATAGSAGNYSVVVTNRAGSATSASAHVSVDYAPSINVQPTSANVAGGNTVTFSVVATGTPAPSYQWYKADQQILGATAASYSIPVVDATNAGTYSVVVSNRAGVVSSSDATLVVESVPVFAPLNASVFATLGKPVSLNAPATGFPSPVYQWFKGDKPIAGATSATYTITKFAATNVGLYKVVATNRAGATTSPVITVALATKPVIKTQPLASAVAVGNPVTLRVIATGAPAPTYQWRFGGSVIPGATSDVYVISSSTVANAGDYTVVVTNQAGAVTSRSAHLTINTPPVITKGPLAQTSKIGASATFSVVATGTAKLTYQWLKNGIVIPKATAATYKIAKTTAASVGEYSVVVSNSVGSVTSDTVTLTIIAKTVSPKDSS
jgi:Immunoglobulin domain/Immunoglobulin I-set domain/NHL repeat